MNEIVIGLQVWSDKNLNVDCFNNGDKIPEAKTPEEWKSFGENQQAAWCYYEFNEENGKLYNAYAINDERGLAPKGWRIPTVSNFEELLNTIDNNLYAIMTNSEDYWDFGYDHSEQDYWGWNYDDINLKVREIHQFNETGFNAIPTGYINNEGVFYSKLFDIENTNVRNRYVTDDKSDAFLFCFSNEGYAYKFCVYSDYIFPKSYINNIENNYGYSIRCISTNTDLTFEKIKSQIKYQPSYYLEVFEQYIDNEELLLYAIKYDAQYFKKASQDQQQNLNFITKALKNNGKVMQFLQADIKSNKEFAIIAVQNNAEAHQFIDESLNNDLEIAKVAVTNNQYALNYLPKHLQTNHEIALIALNTNRDNWFKLDNNLINDPTFLVDAVKIYGAFLQFVEIDFLKHHNIIFNAIKQLSEVYLVSKLYFFLKCKCPSIYEDKSFILNVLNIEKNYDSNEIFDYIPEYLLNDREFVFKAISKNGGDLEFASVELKNDREIVLKAVKQNGEAIKFASVELKNDREIILEAVTKHSYALQFASDELRNDYGYIFEAIKKNGMVLEYISNELRNDREIVLEAVKQNGEALEFASDEFKNDREIVCEAVKFNGWALKYASNQLKNDPIIVLKAIENDYDDDNAGEVFKFASEELKNNRDFVYKAVICKGWALKYASDELKNDREIVLKAIENDFDNLGEVFKFASDELKNNREFVLEIVKEGYFVGIEFASDDLKNDREIVLEAVKKYGMSLQFASDELKNDLTIALEAVKESERSILFVGENILEEVEEIINGNVNDDEWLFDEEE
jgi:uncharacterized protein (TIGR02145 family)